MTPEQRERVMRVIGRTWEPGGEVIREALEAALAQADKVTPEAELHRRIGAAVAAVLPSYATAEWLAAATSGDCEYEGALSKQVVDAVIEAMRGEEMP